MGEIIWRFQISELGIIGTPAVVDGRVYIGGSDRRMYALDAKTGEVIWGFEADKGIYSSAAVAGGRVFFATNNDTLYALDAHTGAFVWKYSGVTKRTTPTVDGRRVFVGGYGKLIALDAATGTLDWEFSTLEETLNRGAGNVQASPLVYNGTVYVGSTNRIVFAVNAANGTLTWKQDLTWEVPTSAATDGVRIYVVTVMGDLHALDPTSGRTLWVHSRRDAWGAPSVRDGVVYRGGFTGAYAVNATSGTVIWSNPTVTASMLSLATSPEVVFLTDSNDVLTLRASTGELLWRRTVARLVESPAVIDGVLYVGSNQFRVLALDVGAGLSRVPDQASGDRDPDVSGLGGPGLAIAVAAATVIGFARTRWSSSRDRR